MKKDLLKVFIDGKEEFINLFNKGLELIDFIVEVDNTIYHIQEGSGSALSKKDIEDGYVDYIDYDVLENIQDTDSIIDGGCILLTKYYNNMTINQIIQITNDFNKSIYKGE